MYIQYGNNLHVGFNFASFAYTFDVKIENQNTILFHSGKCFDKQQWGPKIAFWKKIITNGDVIGLFLP